MITAGNITALFAAATLALTAHGAYAVESDAFETSAGQLTITFIGHGTLMMDAGGTVIHIDPWSRLADYASLPDADIILFGHTHDACSHYKNGVFLFNPGQGYPIFIKKTSVGILKLTRERLEGRVSSIDDAVLF